MVSKAAWCARVVMVDCRPVWIYCHSAGASYVTGAEWAQRAREARGVKCPAARLASHPRRAGGGVPPPLGVLMTWWITRVTMGPVSVTLLPIRRPLSSTQRRQLFFSLILGWELLQVFAAEFEKVSYLGRRIRSLKTNSFHSFGLEIHSLPILLTHVNISKK